MSGRKSFIVLMTISAVLGPAAARVVGSQIVAAQAPPTTYSIKAEMLDADRNSQKKEATVVVTTQGVQLVDPTTTNGAARVGEGHLHYRVDDGPVIATTATKLSFHELASGTHTITVMLAANDHTPLSAPVTFTVRVP